jgi:inositol polyphosphate 5-phosphatase INPP5B/F
VVNDGLTLVAFEFVPRGSVDARVSLPWYSLHPLKGSLAPGTSCEVSVSLRVTEESVHVAHSSPSLEDIVVLHLQNGRDYFITLNGTMKPTLFGRSLEELCSQLPADMAGPGGSASLPIPGVLWKLVDSLNNRIGEAGTKNWFLEGGDDEEMARIREAMSHDGDLDGFGTTSLAHSLVSFLEALPEPILPEEVALQLQVRKVSNAVEEQKVMGFLSTPHYNTFIYVMSFLRELLQTANDNETTSLLTAESLAFVFANAFCSRGSASKNSPTSPRARGNTEVNAGVVQFIGRFL